MMGAPPCSSLFPYTTLFRSCRLLRVGPVSENAERLAGRGREDGLARGSGVRGGRGRPDRRAGLVFDRPPALQLPVRRRRSEEHTSELQSLTNLVCRLLLEKK